MQFWSSAVQMVGRLFGIVTTTAEGATAPLTGIAALALAIAVFTQDLASAFFRFGPGRGFRIGSRLLL